MCRYHDDSERPDDNAQLIWRGSERPEDDVKLIRRL